MSVSKLSLYNDALFLVGEREIASLTESREPRRVLDRAWDAGAVDACLEQGLWKFALRAVEIDYSTSVTPDFGYARAFDKPTDYVRTAAVCADEFFNVPLLQYADEADYWFSDLDTMYVKYVSDDDDYGYDYGKWPQTFSKYVSAYLANEIAPRLTQDKEKRVMIDSLMTRRLKDAKSKDAMNDPTKFPPPGSWVRSRRHGGGGDRGNRGSLIG